MYALHGFRIKGVRFRIRVLGLGPKVRGLSL